ncbi:MAG: hypothetical protein ABSG98_06425 [Anaerolineales bacterium]
MPTGVQIGTMNLAIIEPLPLERNPAAVYLATLASGSRRTMHQALQVVASLLVGGKSDPLAVPWHALRYQHIAAIRSQLAERFAPATANKVLCALRGTLREGWRLGLIGEADY